MGSVININGKDTPQTHQVKINAETEKLIKSLSAGVDTGEHTYYFMPFWFQETDEPGIFNIHHLDGKLPNDLVECIKQMRK